MVTSNSDNITNRATKYKAQTQFRFSEMLNSENQLRFSRGRQNRV